MTAGDDPGGAERLRRLWPLIRAEARCALLVAASIASLGVPLGLIWWAVAPRVELVSTSGGWYPVSEEPEGYVADDGWFALISACAGLVLAILVWRLVRRHRGPAMVLALAGGSILAALLAEWLGHRVGLGSYLRQLEEAEVGTRVFRQPELRMNGLLLVQAFVAIALYTLIAAFHYDPSLCSAPDEAAAVVGEPEPRPRLEAC
jgi:hypothetical protein